MLPLSVSIRLDVDDISKLPRAKAGALVAVQQRGLGFAADTLSQVRVGVREIGDHLERGIRVCSFTLSLRTRPIDWASPEISGAVVSPDWDVVIANDPAEFDPRATPDFELLREGTIPVLATRPSGVVAGWNGGDAYSRRFVDLVPAAAAKRGAVRHRTRLLDDWFTLSFFADRAFLDPLSVRPEKPCAMCGKPHIGFTGIWVARQDADPPATPTPDVLPAGHYGMERRLVVASARAAFMARGAPRMALEPVVAAKSETGRAVAQLVGLLAPVQRE